MMILFSLHVQQSSYEPFVLLDGKALDFLKVRTQTPLDNILRFPEIGIATTKQLLDSPDFQKFLKEKPKFDLLLQEAFVSEGLMAGLSRYFNVPFIGYGTFMPSSWTNYMVRKMLSSQQTKLGSPYIIGKVGENGVERLARSTVHGTTGRIPNRFRSMIIEVGCL